MGVGCHFPASKQRSSCHCPETGVAEQPSHSLGRPFQKSLPRRMILPQILDNQASSRDFVEVIFQ